MAEILEVIATCPERFGRGNPEELDNATIENLEACLKTVKDVAEEYLCYTRIDAEGNDVDGETGEKVK